MEQWSAQDVVAVEDPPEYNMSMEWVKGVMEKLGEEEEEGRGGGRQCLGRRMGSFESVEAEGRQFGRDVRGRLFGVPRAEGQEVPTRVLFDNRDVMPVVKKKSGNAVVSSAENEAADLQTTSTPPLPTTTADSASYEEKGKQDEEEEAAGTAESNSEDPTAAEEGR